MTSNWDTIKGRTAIKLDELQSAENLADQINSDIGLREQSPALQASASRNRQAAFTQFVKAYREVRTAIAYVRHQQGDADSIMPSLYAGRGGKNPITDPVQSPLVSMPLDTQAAQGHNRGVSISSPSTGLIGLRNAIKTRGGRCSSTLAPWLF